MNYGYVSMVLGEVLTVLSDAVSQKSTPLTEAAILLGKVMGVKAMFDEDRKDYPDRGQIDEPRRN